MTSAPHISLDSSEAAFIKHLDTFAHTCEPAVECRIAGGWVRDKILKQSSSDLDIALSIPSGFEFAQRFVHYLQGQGIQTGSVGRVAANPEQSKHLETGTTRLLGLDCDFVGLRSETYTESRIPQQIRLGTPLEDARRRDLTINSLFYNVHTKSIEDLTGHGLDDLQARIARTPMDPMQTFIDDPLRVVRCIRFASRFDLAVEDSVARAMCNAEIRTALANKVSKERMGIEVCKMMRKSPLRAILLMDQYQLHPAIFAWPQSLPRSRAKDAALILNEVSTRFGQADEILWLGAASAPFIDLSYAGKRTIAAVSYVLGDGLKLSNDIRDAVTRLFASSLVIDKAAKTRSGLGTMMRHHLVRPWRRSLIWKVVHDILPMWSGAWDMNAERILTNHQELEIIIKEFDLPTDFDNQPLLDGRQIQEMLALKPGPIIQVIRDHVLEWQLEHPAAEEAECRSWLAQAWEGPLRSEWEAAVPSRRKQ